ncbi:molybdopterin-dependent oxidoreductase [Aromatoleum toluclasticum]|uniref:molybdopterin-dependent oxidoreductase n=1 Tax=Aromatoleum toluclasticum TaxID=92003 RepID=UPI0003719449|nr:molybdopterin-dependent oxidoreductase [Aromatoleum toluclasticum]
MHSSQLKPLPPGQFEVTSFDRFGLGRFANRFPERADVVELRLAGDVARPVTVAQELAALPRVEQVSDFHCVTSWSCRSVRWSGVRFADFYEQVVVPMAAPLDGAEFVVFRGQDGYCSSLPLTDLLASDVLLADKVEGRGLGIEHGAPLRLVAPAHYGYKNVKHIGGIEFWRDRGAYRFPRPYPSLMDHPRARVAFEERAVGIPGWLIRFIYRAMIASAKRKSRKGLQAYRAKNRARCEVGSLDGT